MSEAEDVTGMFSGTAQIYANFGVAVAMVLAGLFATLNRWKSNAGKSQLAPLFSAIEAQNKEIIALLTRMLLACEGSNIHLDRIQDMLQERERREDLEREYNRGRDAQLDRAANTVASRLKQQHP